MMVLPSSTDRSRARRRVAEEQIEIIMKLVVRRKQEKQSWIDLVAYLTWWYNCLSEPKSLSGFIALLKRRPVDSGAIYRYQ
jgi:hypothetical protein